jgi:Ser/Thr protein kinase RdoA (MazF antagonist)
MEPTDPASNEALAHQALAAYDLPEPQLAFIRHSDNVTYKVTTGDSGTYLLRIHQPVTAALGAHGADFNMVNSEMLWLQALNQETDLALQRPVLNRDGDLVTRLTNAGAQIHCTLLTWVEGEPYLRDLECEATAAQIGKILATLHNQAAAWEFPPGFDRPRRTPAYFEGVLRCLVPAVEDGRIREANYTELAQAVEVLVARMQYAGEEHSQVGIIHGDGHKGNMLIHGGEIRLIDFSFCCLAHPLFDLGICLGDMKPELHRVCMAGYRSLRSLPDDYHRWIEGYFIGSVVGAFSFWVANPAAQELLARKLPQITRDFATRYNRDERFWVLD